MDEKLSDNYSNRRPSKKIEHHMDSSSCRSIIRKQLGGNSQLAMDNQLSSFKYSDSQHDNLHPSALQVPFNLPPGLVYFREPCQNLGILGPPPRELQNIVNQKVTEMQHAALVLTPAGRGDFVKQLKQTDSDPSLQHNVSQNMAANTYHQHRHNSSYAKKTTVCRKFTHDFSSTMTSNRLNKQQSTTKLAHKLLKRAKSVLSVINYPITNSKRFGQVHQDYSNQHHKNTQESERRYREYVQKGRTSETMESNTKAEKYENIPRQNFSDTLHKNRNSKNMHSYTCHAPNSRQETWNHSNYRHEVEHDDKKYYYRKSESHSNSPHNAKNDDRSNNTMIPEERKIFPTKYLDEYYRKYNIQNENKKSTMKSNVSKNLICDQLFASNLNVNGDYKIKPLSEDATNDIDVKQQQVGISHYQHHKHYTHDSNKIAPKRFSWSNKASRSQPCHQETCCDHSANVHRICQDPTSHLSKDIQRDSSHGILKKDSFHNKNDDSNPPIRPFSVGHLLKQNILNSISSKSPRRRRRLNRVNKIEEQRSESKSQNCDLPKLFKSHDHERTTHANYYECKSHKIAKSCHHSDIPHFNSQKDSSESGRKIDVNYLLTRNPGNRKDQFINTSGHSESNNDENVDLVDKFTNYDGAEHYEQHRSCRIELAPHTFMVPGLHKQTAEGDKDNKEMRKLYVGDLLESVKKPDLEREFESFGRVKDVWIAHNPPGFAFIEYYEKGCAAKAVRSLDGKNCLGSKVRVEFAKSGPRVQGRGGMRGGMRGGPRGGGAGRGRKRRAGSPLSPRRRRSLSPRRRSPPRRVRSPLGPRPPSPPRRGLPPPPPMPPLFDMELRGRDRIVDRRGRYNGYDRARTPPPPPPPMFRPRSRSPIGRRRSPGYDRSFPPAPLPPQRRSYSRSPSPLGHSTPWDRREPWARNGDRPRDYPPLPPAPPSAFRRSRSRSPIPRAGYSPRRPPSPPRGRSPLPRGRSPAPQRGRSRSPLPLPRGRSPPPQLRGRLPSPLRGRSPPPTLRGRSPLSQHGRLAQPLRGRSPTLLRGRSPPPLRGRSPPPIHGRSPLQSRGLSPPQLRGRSPVPQVRGRSPPLVRGHSPPPVRRRTPTPQRGRSPLQFRGRSPPPLRGRSPPPLRGRTPPPLSGRSPPLLRGRSPPSLRGRSPPPLRGRSPPPLRGRSPPLLRGRSPPPLRGRSPPPLRGRSPPPLRGRSPPPLRGRSPPPLRGRSPPLLRGRSPPPLRGRSPPPLRGRSPPPLRGRSPPPMRGRSPPTMRGRTSPMSHGRMPLPPMRDHSPPRHMSRSISPMSHQRARSPLPLPLQRITPHGMPPRSRSPPRYR